MNNAMMRNISVFEYPCSLWESAGKIPTNPAIEILTLAVVSKKILQTWYCLLPHLQKAIPYKPHIIIIQKISDNRVPSPRKRGRGRVRVQYETELSWIRQICQELEQIESARQWAKS